MNWIVNADLPTPVYSKGRGKKKKKIRLAREFKGMCVGACLGL
jgi:hypothetical protein